MELYLNDYQIQIKNDKIIFDKNFNEPLNDYIITLIFKNQFLVYHLQILNK